MGIAVIAFYGLQRKGFLKLIREAIKRLVQVSIDTALKIADFRQIIAFRNVLIHGYDLVDHELVWSTIENQVPNLSPDVDALLNGYVFLANTPVYPNTMSCISGYYAFQVQNERKRRREIREAGTEGKIQLMYEQAEGICGDTELRATDEKDNVVLPYFLL